MDGQPEQAKDRPVLIVEDEIEGIARELPATAVYEIIKRLCLTDRSGQAQ
jgi:hypothetical protein